MSISELLAELRRRRVFRVAAVYLVVGWLAVEVVSTTAPLLRLPDWTPTLVLVLLLVGFPLAVLLAWAFELTPEGVRRAEPTRAAHGSPGTSRQMPGVFGAGILLALVALGGYAWLRATGGPGEPGTPTERSIAVLPFDDMSAGGDQAFFSDGITEDILTKLAAVPGLRVISRTSVMRYRGPDKPGIRDIGATLGVRYVLEGSVRRAGDQVRITGQLIDARTDEHVWAESYDRNATDVFAVQSEIAREIVRQLEIRLTPELDERLAGGATSPEVYELYLKALSYFSRTYTNAAEYQGLQASAMALLRQALQTDPAYAPAFAALARAYRLHDGLPEGVRLDSATAFAERAIALDPDLADGYAELGQVHLTRGDDRAGRAQIELALELNANHAEALRALAELHLEKGRLVEAVDAAERAIAVDPNVYAGYQLAAVIHLTLGLHDRAEEHFRTAFERVQPHPGRLECMLAWVDLERGDSAAALEHTRRMLEVEDAAYARNCAVGAFASTGRLEEARGLATRLQRELPLQQQPLLSFAYLAQEAGDAKRSAEFLDDAVAVIEERTRARPPNSLDHAQRAGIAALRGQPEEVPRHLMAGRTDGFLAPVVQQITWLPTLRDHPEVRAMLREHDAKVAAMREQVLTRERAAPRGAR